LPDGSALVLAVKEWLTPQGRVIWHHGITPDDQVSLPATAQLLLPEAQRSMTADQIQTSDDAQFLRALQVLRTATAQAEHAPD
jgi:carboxyl-terminal processing protease